jgi:hypothetical protein
MFVWHAATVESVELVAVFNYPDKSTLLKRASTLGHWLVRSGRGQRAGVCGAARCTWRGVNVAMRP